MTELILRHTTVTDNTAAYSLSLAGVGGGIFASGTSGQTIDVSIENSVIAHLVSSENSHAVANAQSSRVEPVGYA